MFVLPCSLLTKEPGPRKREYPAGLLAAALCMHLFLIVSAFAEPLTLEQGIQTALKNNPAIRASIHSVHAAEQGVLEARGRFLPRMDITESFMRTTGPGEVFWTELSQERFSLSEFALANPNDPDPIANYNMEVRLVQPIYAGGKIRTGYQISKLQREAAENSRRRTEQEIIREFTGAYYGALLAGRFITVAELAKTSVRAHARIARDLLDQGMVLRSDLLRVNVHLSEVEAMLITSRNQRKLAAANLNRIMGVEQDREYELMEKEEPETFVMEGLDQLIREAIENRPDLAGLSLMEKSAEKGITMERASFLPSLNVVASYDKNDRDFLGDDGEYWSVMAMARMNLFEGFASRARVHRARAERARVSSLLEQAAQGVELEVRNAYLRLNEAHARLEVARRATVQAEESMKIIEDRYAAGMAVATELLDTETALTRARTNEARARYDLDTARTDLDLAAGRL